MADTEQLRILLSGSAAWEDWRAENQDSEIDLSRADLRKAALRRSNLTDANLTEANLAGASLCGADLSEAILTGANLEDADLALANLWNAVLTGANLSFAHLEDAQLNPANLDGADLRFARLFGANLAGASLRNADLRGAKLMRANLIEANLSGADLRCANLNHAILVRTRLENAFLAGAWVYGISVWDAETSEATQSDLVITPQGQSRITVDNLEVAQFVYLMLNNQKIRSVIDTIGNKGVLILGRFGDRKQLLEAISQQLRERDYLPIVFDFEKPIDRDFTETVLTLAGMSRFIIADITAPRSVPMEAQVVIPNYRIPFVPIIQMGEVPFSLFQDLWRKHRDWVLEPRSYASVEELIARFDAAVIRPANDRLLILRSQNAKAMAVRQAGEFE